MTNKKQLQPKLSLFAAMLMFVVSYLWAMPLNQQKNMMEGLA